MTYKPTIRRLRNIESDWQILIAEVDRWRVNQGKYTAVAETEWRWDFAGRWSLDAFGGVGRTAPRRGDFSDGETAWNAGAGFRYLLARLFGIRGGLDVARGPEDWAVYIIVGSAWGKY
jgi:hypothetical protein